MKGNRVRELWRAGEPVLTGWCSTTDPYATEIMVRCGFDALILDMQHGMGIGPQQAASWLQVVGQSDAVPVVRVPWNDPTPIQCVLDAGAMGIIVPMVNSVSDAQKAVGACRYAPDGYRSVGPNRARLLGGVDYVERANREIICLVMIETFQGVESVEQIAGVEGLDGFFVGPADLALSMGFEPTFDCSEPAHCKAVERILSAAKDNDRHAGIFTPNASEAVRRFRQGYNLNPAAVDMLLFSGALRDSLKAYKEALKRTSN